MKAPSSPDSHRRVGVSGFPVPWASVPRNPGTHLTIRFCVFLNTLLFRYIFSFILRQVTMGSQGPETRTGFRSQEPENS
jgi:hypothetical protein